MAQVDSKAFFVCVRSLLLLCLLAPFAGCGDDYHDGVTPPAVSRNVWIGTYSAGAQLEHGVMAMDLTTTAADVTGLLILRSRPSTAEYLPFHLRGTVRGDSLILGPDPTWGAAPGGLQIRAARQAGRLTGRLTFLAVSLDASLDCAAFTVGSIAPPQPFAVTDTTIIGVTSVGDELWTSTAGFDYVVFDTSGVCLRRVPVLYYPDATWVSDALTSDGTRLWGQYPGRIVGGTPADRSMLVAFTPAGEITARHEVPHRISGLAYDGAALWSLPVGGDHFYRLDPSSGAVLDSVEVAVPDLSDFASDGTRFWATGWFLNLLYKIDSQGQILRVYDQPSEGAGDRPSGLTFMNGDLWLARTNTIDSWLYRTRVEP